MRKFRGPFTKWFGARNKNALPLADLKENKWNSEQLSPLPCVIMRGHQNGMKQARLVLEHWGAVWHLLGVSSTPVPWWLGCECAALSSVIHLSDDFQDQVSSTILRFHGALLFGTPQSTLLLSLIFCYYCEIGNTP